MQGGFDPDLVLQGLVQNSPTIRTFGVYRNDGSDGGGGWRFAEVNAGLFPGDNIEDLAWLDVTGDKLPDLVAAGGQGPGDPSFVGLWRNISDPATGAVALSTRTGPSAALRKSSSIPGA